MPIAFLCWGSKNKENIVFEFLIIFDLEAVTKNTHELYKLFLIKKSLNGMGLPSVSWLPTK